jgi:hypothetical protein
VNLNKSDWCRERESQAPFCHRGRPLKLRKSIIFYYLFDFQYEGNVVVVVVKSRFGKVIGSRSFEEGEKIQITVDTLLKISKKNK